VSLSFEEETQFTTPGKMCFTERLQNDHEFLRRDAVFKMIAGRSPDDPKHLAGQSTLSRFENSIGAKDLFRLRDVLFDQFIASFQTRPAQITIDIDAFDDPTHCQQQLTFFHGNYKQFQYFGLPH
jgi:hypothetical protein